ncbi:MAG: protein kinase, partial [Candidatus Acidiferrales bacterium]
VLASLNHPNIASIYGFEDSGNFHAFVMELVEGPTLADRIKQGAISREEALPIAKQICEGVEFAHERGIIHRDLKPANLKVTPDGAVKILDFGLAKALETQDSGADISNSPTLTIGATRAGMILGTAAYMSPEQAKGRPADRRSDIWAFGCVLYEMLSGKQPFNGETVSDTLAEVLKFDPDWNALPAETPASVQRLVRRCLVKDPKQRLQAIGEARITIGQALDPSAATSGTDFASPAADVGDPRAALPAWRRALPWAAAAILLITSAIFAALFWRAASVPARPVQAYILPPEGVNFAFAAYAGTAVISPDGEKLVFVAKGSDGKQTLWLRDLDSLSGGPLEGTEGASFPFWSPDSLFVGYFVPGKLMKINASGGPAQTVCDAASGRGGTWSADGVIVFAPKTSGTLEQVPAAGGNATALATADKTSHHLQARWPVFLPDGNHFLYFGGNPYSVSSAGASGIYVGSLNGEDRKFLFAADSDALYAPPGYVLFLRGRTLMAQPFDANGLKLTGDAFPLAEHVANPAAYRLGHFSVSQHGELVYDEADEDQSQVTWMDASGKQLGTVGEPGVVAFLRLSPDGKTLVEAIEDPASSNLDLWLVDLARGVRTRFTFDAAANLYPEWSPDGTQIAFSSTSAGNVNIYEKAANGTGTIEPLVQNGIGAFLGDWSRDGRFIAYWRPDEEGGGGMGIWILPLFGDKKPIRLLQSQFNELGPAFSPDGKWLSYGSNESGRFEVFVTSLPQASSKWQVSSGGADYERWQADGKKLFYLSGDNKLMSVDIRETGGSIEIGNTQTLFQMAPASSTAPAYDVTSDGKKFLVAVPVAASGAEPVTLVTNWLAAVKKP